MINNNYWENILINKGFQKNIKEGQLDYNRIFVKETTKKEYTILVANIVSAGHITLTVKRGTYDNLRILVPHLALYSQDSFEIIFTSFLEIIQKWLHQF